MPTLNSLHDVRVEFFETDNRNTNKFSIIQKDVISFEGETNWVGYRVTFNDLADVNVECLLTMNTFTFSV